MNSEQSRLAAQAANRMLEKTEHGNIITAGAIETLFDNFDRIPVDVLQKFASAFNPDQDCKKTRIFTREEAEKILEDLIETPALFLEAVNNEFTDESAATILATFEIQK